MRFRSYSLLIAMMLGVTSCGASTSTAPTPAAVANRPDQVLFSLDWAVSGRHAPYFVALDKGYYSEENLSVTIVRGYNSTDSIKQVASDRSQFAFADIGTLVLGRGNDTVPVKAVAAIYANAPHLLFCNAEAGISTPKDLEGHVIGAPAGNSHRVLFPAFAQLTGVDATKVTWQTLDATLLGSTFLSKQVDCIPEYFTPLLEKQAAEANIAFSIIRFSDYGMNFYSNGLVASESTIADNPELVRRFVRAILKGFQYTFDHKEEAVQILQKYHREVEDQDIAIQEINLVQDLVMSDEARAHEIGYFDQAKVESTIKLISEAFDLKAPVSADELYTNAFLPGK